MNQDITYPVPIINDYARDRGVCLLGEPGTGVTHHLTTLLDNDITKGKRIILFDHFGKLSEELGKQQNQTIVWKVGEKNNSYFIDLFSTNTDSDFFQIAEKIIDLMYTLYDPNHTGLIGPRFEHAIRNAVVALLDAKLGSFFNLTKILTDSKYLQEITQYVKHESVRTYFNDQLAQTSDFHKSEVLDYIVSKLSTFIEPTSIIGNITNPANSTSFSKLLEEETSSLVLDFSYVKMQPPHLRKTIYQLILNQLLLSIQTIDNNFNNVCLFIDEVDHFDYIRLKELVNLSRAQKMRVIYSINSLSMASKSAQYSYLAGKSVITYRVAPPDARDLEPYFAGYKTAQEISQLPNFKCFYRMRTESGIEFGNN